MLCVSQPNNDRKLLAFAYIGRPHSVRISRESYPVSIIQFVN